MKLLNIALAAGLALAATGATVTAADARPHMKRLCKMVRGPHHHMIQRCTTVRVR